MKIVNLSGPAVIAGAVRYPVEGALTVTNEEAASLKASGRLDGDPEDLPEADEPGTDVGDALDNEKVADLKATAAAENIDLGSATTKPDIIAAIRAAREAAKEA